ncbi:MAG: hypothetical protein PHP53_18750 [Prolixibacteraceae bacterium]|nr:hypothetical protein [Prolixibacteraceae bacterium]
MKVNLFLAVLLALLISGCQTLKFKRVVYNDQKGIYEYAITNKQKVILRNDSNQLITKSNIEQFERELKQNKFRYPFKRRQEKSDVIRNSDFRLTSTYSQVSSKILSKDYDQALDEISNLKRQCPEIIKYTDYLFLEAYCYEQLQKQDSANLKYSDFLNYSSGKYSARFRGFRDSDNKDSLWILQRNYAKHFLSGQTPTITEDAFKKLNPSYYFSSFHPGYNLNREDLDRGVNGYFWYWLGYSTVDNISFGIQTYHKLSDRLDINPAIYTSGNVNGINLALPIQVYKTRNNNFGFRVSPFIKYVNIDSLTVDNVDYKIDQGIINGGLKLSLGYYMTQKLSIGAYYTYNLFNGNNHLTLSKSNLDIWWNNQYDVSLYYGISKAFSLKTGIKNGGLVCGLLWSGWEISYDITNSALIFGIDLY